MQDHNRLPPAPVLRTRKEQTAARKLQRKAANVPLPQLVDADLSDHSMEEVELSGVHATQSVQAEPIPPHVPGTEEPQNNDWVTAGDYMSFTEYQSPVPYWGLPPGTPYRFQDPSLTLQERVSVFNHFAAQVKATTAEWNKIEGEKPECIVCGKKHPPPCMSPEELRALGAVFKEGKKLRAEFVSAKMGPPTLPKEEMLDGEVVMRMSSFGFTEWKSKTAFCKLCAKWHPGGAKECTAPFCTKGCNLNHQPLEGCGQARKRFQQLNLIKDEDGEGEEDEEKQPAPAPREATAAGGISTAKFGAFLNSIDDDPHVINMAGRLFSDMVTSRKRPAEESVDKTGSKTSKKGKTGGGKSCQDPKPPPKGPNGPGGRGGRGGKGGRGGRGASSLNGSVYSVR
jgi:hypothetical protein